MLKACVVAVSAGVAFGQSVATYTLVADPFILGGEVDVQLFGQATAGQIGNNSGINGVNLSFEINNATVDISSITSNGEVFGVTNIVEDAEGFDVSFSSNSFTGNNFSAGIPLLSFTIDIVPFTGAYSITSSQGTISTFAAATGLPGAFQPSIAYDVINFAELHQIPAPAAVGVLGLGGLMLTRRRR